MPCLTLPLFILRFFLVNDTKYTFAADNDVIRANFLYTSTNFHVSENYLSENTKTANIAKIIFVIFVAFSVKFNLFGGS